ncbi:DUF305 domain-containing protein [Streptomyces sp. NPDC060194]|uniref:DUF305 domain-containing protein n=1 Tax=Streptomyces sp. NPDC060194 TaxID=3347069 RepID=UPI0036503504
MKLKRSRRRLRALAVPGIVVATAAWALTGCDGGQDDARSASSTGPSVIAPGKPGEQARTLSPEEARKEAPDDTPNGADFAYVRMMTEHHQQAVAMTGLVPDRGESTKIKALAARIAATQQPEIDAMQGWLKAHGGDKRKDDHADHGPMAGMATEAQLRKLRAADGKAFDQLFLKLMITHHEGAVTMAADALAQGNNVAVEEMANDVISTQTVEIGRMNQMS